MRSKQRSHVVLQRLVTAASRDQPSALRKPIRLARASFGVALLSLCGACAKDHEGRGSDGYEEPKDPVGQAVTPDVEQDGSAAEARDGGFAYDADVTIEGGVVFPGYTTRVDAAVRFPEGGVVMNTDITVAPALPSGQVIAPWDAFCVGTFTRDYSFMQDFDGLASLRMKVGDRYLLGPSEHGPSIIYITETGAVRLDLRGETAVPYTSSCTSAEWRVGVFADTTLYLDEAMTIPLCVLQAGQVLAPGGTYSFSSLRDTVLVEFSALAAPCGGITSGYVRPGSAKYPSGSSAQTLPFALLAAPKP